MILLTIVSQVGRIHFCVSGVLLAASAEANSMLVSFTLVPIVIYNIASNRMVVM